MGSPPQVRGKPWSAPPSPCVRRITPAGAGKTFTKYFTASFVPDHPRRCGENLGLLPLPLRSGGSPPQVRGKPAAQKAPETGLWITPAGAGKTRGGKECRTANRDHPRRCGENCAAAQTVSLCSGSPPQVRGKHFGGASDRKPPRITPAGAGKTLNPPTQRINDQDHPRRCGENSL